MKNFETYFDLLFNKSKSEFNKVLEKNLKKNTKTFIVTANPESFTYGEKDEEFHKLMTHENTIIVPDGIGIVKAARIMGKDVSERIPGIEIAEELLVLAEKLHKSLYLFGASEEVLNALEKKIKKEYPNINFLGMTNGYVKDKEKSYKKIIDLKPDIVLVALGIPAQEKLIFKYLDKFDKGIFVGVGGSFDVMSGMKKRAPKIFQKLNLEWFYRIVKEPKRLKRFWDNNIKFIFKIKKLSKSIKHK